MDSDGSNSLSLREVQSLLVSVNVTITAKDLQHKFQKFDKSKDGQLSFEEFQAFFRSVDDKPGPEIDEMFARFADGARVLNAEQLGALLESEQGETLKERPGVVLSKIKSQVAELWRRKAAGSADDQPEDDALEEFEEDTLQLTAADETRAEAADGGDAAVPSAAGASDSAAPGAKEDEAREALRATLTAEREAAEYATKEHRPEGLSARELAAFLTSTELNSPLLPEAHDMSRPLSHYFISSTHNSYLTGNQLNGKSRSIAIKRALSLGARVIELDCYSDPDGGEEPWVTHGGTLTSRLAFREAIRAVAEYAFRSENIAPSKAPVILTLENHCSQAGQALQARILREELGSLLYVPPSPRPAVYVSPRSLEGRVVIRDKPGKFLIFESSEGAPAAESAAAEEAVERDEDDEDDDDDDVDDDEEEQEAARQAAIEAAKGKAAAPAAATGPAGKAGKEGKAGKAHKAHKVLHPDLMALVAIPNTKFKGFHKLGAYSPGPASSSFSEEKMEAIAKGKKAKGTPQLITKLAQTHLLRVYPKGIRVDSSNFDPGRFWALGCQLAALNYQHGSRSVYANQAQFSQNGGSGYVLKPDWMLREAATPDVEPVSLTVTVVSGHYLPKPLHYRADGDVIDPFVEVHIVGAAQDTKLHTTAHINDNGFNPRWLTPHGRLRPTATFHVARPDIAVLLFVIKDKNSTGSVVVAQAGVPLRALRTGLRALALNDTLSRPLPASRLMIRTSLATK